MVAKKRKITPKQIVQWFVDNDFDLVTNVEFEGGDISIEIYHDEEKDRVVLDVTIPEDEEGEGEGSAGFVQFWGWLGEEW